MRNSLQCRGSGKREERTENEGAGRPPSGEEDCGPPLFVLSKGTGAERVRILHAEAEKVQDLHLMKRVSANPARYLLKPQKMLYFSLRMPIVGTERGADEARRHL